VQNYNLTDFYMGVKLGLSVVEHRLRELDNTIMEVEIWIWK